MIEHRGKNYNGQLDISEIAKLIRTEIKKSVKAKLLPDLKYSVRISRYAGGQSLKVYVNDGCCGRRFESKAEKYVFEYLDKLVQSYNRYESDSMTDYWNGNYFGFVLFPSNKIDIDNWYPLV